jgi:prophage regulatory protein
MRILRLDEIKKVTGLSAATIQRREKSGEFPVRRSLGGGAVGWLEEEVDEWIAQRPALRSTPEECAST